MLKLRKAAITGGLSCGKSSVCLFLKDLGAYIVSADKIVHQLLSSDPNLGQEIVRLLGPGVLTNQKLDRSRIANIVFHDLELLKALETLVHPKVYKEINIEHLKQQNQLHPPSLFVAEIPLLFETHEQKNFDITIVVTADSNICCKRFMKSTGLDKEEFENRMARQLPSSEKAMLADHVIINNGTFSDLKQTTNKLYLKPIEE